MRLSTRHGGGMTRRPAELPPSLPDAFTVGLARASGVTRGRLRSGDLRAPFHGIRSRGDVTDVRALAASYLPKLRPGEHISHATAIAVVGGWIPDRLRADVDVAVPRPHGRARGVGVRGHEAAAPSRWRFGPVPIEHPAVAWCRSAELMDERELIIAADSLMRRHDPVLSREQLGVAVAAWTGRRGVRVLRRAYERCRERTDSVAETELRLDAEALGMTSFEVNAVIRDESGRFVAYGDLVDAERRVLLEYDGQQHRLDDTQYGRDVDRLDDLARLGWRVIRVNKSHRGARRRAILLRAQEALTR